MPEERFTQKEAKRILEVVDDLFSGLPKTRQGSYLGHLNDICLFIEAAGRVAPKAPK